MEYTSKTCRIWQNGPVTSLFQVSDFALACFSPTKRTLTTVSENGHDHCPVDAFSAKDINVRTDSS